MEQKEKLQFVIEQLEERIAPGVVHGPGEKGNNGWGNGEDVPPGNSLAAQAFFDKPDTTGSPSHSAASGGGDR